MLALFALKSISVVIYGSALYAASGLLFPLPAAVLVNLMGTVIMVSIPYSVGAANGAEMLENLFRKHPRAAMLKSLRAGSDFFFALLVRLLGVLPRGSGGGLYGGLWGEISRVSGRNGAGHAAFHDYIPADGHEHSPGGLAGIFDFRGHSGGDVDSFGDFVFRIAQKEQGRERNGI